MDHRNQPVLLTFRQKHNHKQNRTDRIEQEVNQTCSTCVYGSTDRGDERRYGRTDVRAENDIKHRVTATADQQALARHSDDDRGNRTGRLQKRRKYDTKNQ